MRSNSPRRFAVRPTKTSAHPDRDLIHGGDGNDTITGNQGLDRIFGDNGVNSFTAEPVEVRDQQSFETGSLPTLAELSTVSLEPARNPSIQIPDPHLRAAIAEAVGIPVRDTASGPVTLGAIRLTDVTQLSELQSSRPVTELFGLELAENLKTLDLSRTLITDASLVQISTLRQLEVLDLSTTAVDPFSEEVQQLVSELPRLQELYLPQFGPSDFW